MARKKTAAPLPSAENADNTVTEHQIPDGTVDVIATNAEGESNDATVIDNPEPAETEDQPKTDSDDSANTAAIELPETPPQNELAAGEGMDMADASSTTISSDNPELVPVNPLTGLGIYRVTRQADIRHNGRLFREGDSIELESDLGQAMLSGGYVEPQKENAQ